MGAFVVVTGLSSALLAEPPRETPDFDVEFNDCTEYVGIGLVPHGAARALVPASYALVDVDGAAVLVVRVSGCEAVSVDGKPARPAQVAQVGVRVAGPDTTADINNYTLFYVTDSGQLLGKLTAAGAEAVLDAQLLYELDSTSGALQGVVDAPQVPLLSLSGSATPPPASPTVFVASWWADGRYGPIRMRTVFPNITFGSATVTLSTDPGSQLEALIGALPYGFSLLDSYNTFDDAAMEVKVAP